jgi:transposase
VQNLAESNHNIPTSINALVGAFDCQPSRVKAAFAHGLDDRGRRGKHNSLAHDRERQILDWVRQKAEQETPVTKGEIREYCTTQFQIPITRGWVN